MIGIRVPEENDLPARLKEMSEKTRLSYFELLEKLITKAELDTSTLMPDFEAKEIIALQTLDEKISDLSMQIDDIGSRLKSLEKAAAQEKDTNSSQTSEATPVTHPAFAQKASKSYSDEAEISETIKVESEENAATIAYIQHLSAEGLSLRKIAERLMAEGRPTISGSGVWHFGTVRKILAKHPKG